MKSFKEWKGIMMKMESISGIIRMDMICASRFR